MFEQLSPMDQTVNLVHIIPSKALDFKQAAFLGMFYELSSKLKQRKTVAKSREQNTNDPKVCPVTPQCLVVNAGQSGGWGKHGATG